MTLYSILLHLHSGFRYVVMILVLAAIFQSYAGWAGRNPYTPVNRKINMFAMISAHIQLIIGLVLYFVSPYVQFSNEAMKDATTRYWTMEHIVMMIFAIALITYGHIRSKRIVLPEAKHRIIAIYYTLALIIIILAIIQSHRPFFGISH
jgi:NADH:ubiquinone oxidoreductase subunit H